LKTSATTLLKDILPSPREQQQQQQQHTDSDYIHFNEESDVSFTDHLDMVLDEPPCEEEKERKEKRMSAPTLAFADNFFGFFSSKLSSSSMTSHAHVSTSVNLDDPSQRPLDRVILLQQANGR
jgi:hypothetical protein